MAPKALLDAAFWEQRRARHAWLDELDEFLRTLAEEKLIRLAAGDRQMRLRTI